MAGRPSRWALAHILVLVSVTVPLPFPLLLLLSFRRLFSAVGDRMSTILPHYDVPFVRISDACLKCAARGLLKILDAKITQKIATCAPSHNFVGKYLRN